MVTNLENLIYEIALENPQGLKHADFVKKVLQSGYCARDISVTVYQIIRRFCEEGRLRRRDNEVRGTREYQPVCYC